MMPAGAVGAMWGTLVLALAWAHRPAPAGLRRRLAAPAPQRHPRVEVTATAVGRAALHLLARSGPRGRVMASGASAPRVGRAVLAAAGSAFIAPMLVVPVGALVWAWPALGARRARRRRIADVQHHLPEAVDLLALAVGAGLTVPLAIAAVARRSPGPVGTELARVMAEVGAGRRLGDAVAELPERLGEDARPLAAALIAAVRDGSPLADGLDLLATELRADRRRRAEAAVRRVPVKLLFPLVVCILPAFVLLTVAPLLAGALSALRP